MRQGVQGTPLQPGRTVSIFPTGTRTAGTYDAVFAIESTGLILSLWVDGFASAGTLSVEAFTFTDEDKTRSIISFPVQTTSSSNLIIVPANEPILSNILVRATIVGGDCTFQVFARGVASSTSGESDAGTLAGCNRIIEEIQIQDDGELLILDPACVEITDSDSGRQMLITSSSVVQYS